MPYSGRFSPKNIQKYLGDTRNIVYRSSWELRVMKYCDQTPGILKWASEEFAIPYVSPVDGRRHRYFPDFYLEVKAITDANKKFVIEIKPKAQCRVPVKRKRKTAKFLSEAATYAVNQAKWEAATAYCKERNWTFLVLTEDHLFGGL